MLKLYSHLFSPEHHPDFTRRATKAITRNDLDNAIQFTSLRVFSVDTHNRLINYAEDMELYAETLGIGKIIWPFNKALFADNIADLAQEAQKRGYWLFDFWGYVPGSDPNPPAWGQYKVPPRVLDMLEEVLGPRFIGMDNGEQDGRYIGGYAPLACPSPLDRKHQCIAFYRHFDRMGDDLGNRISVLCSLTFPHYFARQTTTTIIGAETAQALINTNLWYAFIRGAGKQYGLLWFGNASIWNRWGYKSYESAGGQGSYTWGPDSGTSLSLLKRLLYAEYLYNCDILGFEQSWVLGDNTEKRIEGLPTPMETDASTKVLTPVGHLQVDAQECISGWGYPGAMHVPVAIILDWAKGWVPPRHLYTNKTHHAWGNLPYSMGDFQLHALFSLIYPGYEDSGFFRDERGFLTATPFTDCVDVLTNDARAELIDTYNIVVLGGEHKLDAEFVDKLAGFTGSGGRLVLFGHSLGTLPASSLCVDTQFADALVKLNDEVRINDKAWVELHWGAGVVYAFSSDYGLVEVTPLPGSPLENGTETSLPVFYDLSATAKSLLSHLFLEQRAIWSTNDNLMTVVNTGQSRLSFTVGVMNNTGDKQPFELKSYKDSVISRSCVKHAEGLLGEPLTTEPGCVAFEPGSMALEPGGVAVFAVELEKGSETAKDLTIIAKPRVIYRETSLGCRCSLGRPASLKETLICLPTLHHWFAGVKVDARYVEERDISSLEADGWYLKSHGLALTIDLTGLMNLYPDLTFIDNIPGAWEASMRRVRSLIDKAAVLNADSAVIGLHRIPENHMTAAQMLAKSEVGVAEVCATANEVGVTIYLQHSPGRPNQAPTAMHQFVVDTRSKHSVPNLEFAFNTSHAIIAGDIRIPDGDVGMVLASTPLVDGFGQLYDCHEPITGSEWEEVVTGQVAVLASRKAMVCLDVAYVSWSAAYRDVATLLGTNK